MAFILTRGLLAYSALFPFLSRSLPPSPSHSRSRARPPLSYNTKRRRVCARADKDAEKDAEKNAEKRRLFLFSLSHPPLLSPSLSLSLSLFSPSFRKEETQEPLAANLAAAAAHQCR